jgi:hypothetical protein
MKMGLVWSSGFSRHRLNAELRTPFSSAMAPNGHVNNLHENAFLKVGAALLCGDSTRPGPSPGRSRAPTFIDETAIFIRRGELE